MRKGITLNKSFQKLSVAETSESFCTWENVTKQQLCWISYNRTKICNIFNIRPKFFSVRILDQTTLLKRPYTYTIQSEHLTNTASLSRLSIWVISTVIYLTILIQPVWGSFQIHILASEVTSGSDEVSFCCFYFTPF